MPHLVQMDKKLREKGLVIIGAESQGSSAKEIKAVTENAKVEYTITEGANGPLQIRGLPTALVFDATGKMIFNGHPRDKQFEKTIKDALKEVKSVAPTKSEEKTKKTNQPLIAQRRWTNTEGKTITASVTEVNGDEIIFKLHNLKSVKYPLNQLSDSDEEMIKKALEEAKKETE